MLNISEIVKKTEEMFDLSWKGLFPRISTVLHCINFGVAMFLYACGYFPDRCLKFLSLKFAPKLTLGCIVSNCGTQASWGNPGTHIRTVQSFPHG